MSRKCDDRTVRMFRLIQTFAYFTYLGYKLLRHATGRRSLPVPNQLVLKLIRSHFGHFENENLECLNVFDINIYI